MARRIALAILCTSIGWPAFGGDPITARASPAFGHAPSDVVVQAAIEPHADNRSVSFEIDSGVFYTSSTSELEGERAARVKEVRFRSLPPGSYGVRVTLRRTDGVHVVSVGTVQLW